ncbi:hypothetical protein GCM10008986_16810 [Salinibacillus aidingensis]|uniref:Phage tail component, N-terminal domain-containing protein n=1 Tax=Salinibacillus aidingensis TaxID=237684 RepID=A0ABN1B6H3_9BACI
MGATYRGKHSSDFGLAVQTNPHILPDFSLRTTNIPGMPGAHYQGNEYGMRRIPITIGFIGKDVQDYESRLRALADWLRPDLGPGVYVSDNEPDKFNYAVLQSVSFGRFRRIAEMGEGDLVLVCPDPFAYESKEQSKALPANIVYDGTADTYPIITARFNQPTTHLSIMNGDQSIDLGKPDKVTETAVAPETLVLHDTMEDTSLWQTATEVDNGSVTGSMTDADGPGFSVSDYGTVITPHEFQGPSLQRAIGASLQDFYADILVHQFNLSGNTGIIEIYFRDANGNNIAKFGFGDSHIGFQKNEGVLQLGGTSGVRNPLEPDDRSEWNNFNGIIRVRRWNNRWLAYLAQRDENGNYRGEKSVSYLEPIYTTPVDTIQVAIRKWGDTTPNDQGISEIRVYQLNDTSGANEVPEIAVAGDEITVDTATGDVRKNGEPRMDLVGLSTDFWALEQGENIIDVQPSGVADLSMKYRNRYL